MVTWAAAGALTLLPLFFLPHLFVHATIDTCNLDCTRDPNERPNRLHTDQRPATRPYPYYLAPAPTPHKEFCQLGCTYFYSTPAKGMTNITCKSKCDEVYNFPSSIVQYADLIEVARWECRDGCDLALALCQPGYYCRDGAMRLCPPGQWRDLNYSHIEQCFNCEKGRYRPVPGGVSMASCIKCPAGYFLNATGATEATQCKRCPDGTFAPEPGMDLCKCITPRSCLPEWQNFQRASVPFIGRW